MYIQPVKRILGMLSRPAYCRLLEL